MNDKDPIIEIKNKTKEVVLSTLVIFFIFILLCGAIAPMFSPLIREELNRRDYSKESVNQTMTNINISLWIVCVITWIILLLTNCFSKSGFSAF